MIAAWLLPALLALPASAGGDPGVKAAADAVLGLSALAPAAPPPDAAAEEAGRRLFFDPALSPGRDRSCASCHDPARAWAGGARASGGREVPSLLGSGRPGPFFWDGRARSLEDAILSELGDPRAMGLDERALAARLDGALLPSGGGSRASRAARALAAFLRARAAGGRSAFHRALTEPGALTPEAGRGLALFAGKGRCASCHVGPALSDGAFYRVGLTDADPPDRGREAVTPVRPMSGAFRTPSLLAAAQTPPYMHDGRLKTLGEVVDFFDRGGDEALNKSPDVSAIGFTGAEREDLLAFLRALSEPVASPEPAVPARAAPSERSLRAEASAALAARDRPALRDAADAWARALAARRAGGGENACLEFAAIAAQDAGEMARTGRSWPALAEAVERAAGWSRECAFRLRDAAGEEDLPAGARAEALLARARELVSQRERADPGSPEARACRAGFDEGRLLSRLRTRDFDDDREQNLMKALVVLQSYRAMAQDSPKPCDVLDLPSMAVGVEASGARRCREFYLDLAAARALAARSPAFVPACRDNVVLSYPDRSPADAERLCGAILAGVDDPRALCAALAPRDLDAALVDACVARYAMFSRDEGDLACKGLSAGPSLVYEVCVDVSRYLRARRSGRPDDCGDSKACRLMMGAGAALIAAQREDVARLACARPAPPASLARVDGVLSEAESALAEREKARAPQDRAAAREIDALLEAAGRLALRARAGAAR